MSWKILALKLAALRGVATLAKGVWNEILSVTSDGVWVRSSATGRRRFIPSQAVLRPHDVTSNGCVVRALGRAVGTY